MAEWVRRTIGEPLHKRGSADLRRLKCNAGADRASLKYVIVGITTYLTILLRTLRL